MKRYLSVICSLVIAASLLATSVLALPSDFLGDLTIPDDSIVEIEQPESGEVAPLSEQSGIISGGVYRIKNSGSGKYLNVHNGVDAVGTNIYQWTGDNSQEQNFRVVYNSTHDAYKFYPMCSSNGSNRVVGINRSTSGFVSGENILLLDERDMMGQSFRVLLAAPGHYRIESFSGGLSMCVDDDYNGTASGTASTSNGNVYMSTYLDSWYQLWSFELVSSSSPSTPQGSLDSVSTSGIGGWAWRNDMPETPIDVHLYLNNRSTGEQTVYAMTANHYRSDLSAYGYGNGNHGYNYPVDWRLIKPGNYYVYAYGIGANGNNPALDGSPIAYTVRSVESSVDWVNENGISGWMWKPDAPNSPINAHIYIRRPNGETAYHTIVAADDYRADLVTAGKGNGYHAFTQAIDWSQLPEERLSVEIYAVDGSNVNPSIYTGYYENRLPINLVGMYDEKSGRNFSEWMGSDLIASCQNIGCSNVNVYDSGNDSALLQMIKGASFTLINTHGHEQYIKWYEDPYGVGADLLDSLTAFEVENLEDGYFDDTRCVLLLACETGKGGATADNFANALHSKGVETVVSFQKPIVYSRTANGFLTDRGSIYWAKRFVYYLGQGYTVQQAKTQAYNETLIAENTISNGTSQYDYELSSLYISGNADQVVKH